MRYENWNRNDYERGRRELYFSPTKGTIESDNGVPIPVEKARQLFKDRDYTDTNIAFLRLAAEFDFDVDACMKWYADQD